MHEFCLVKLRFGHRVLLSILERNQYLHDGHIVINISNEELDFDVEDLICRTKSTTNPEPLYHEE